MSVIGRQPHTISVDRNGDVYSINFDNGSLYRWSNGHNSHRAVFHLGNMTNARSLFVDTNGDVYLGIGNNHSGVYRWTQNFTVLELALETKHHCYGLFVALNGSIYCSLHFIHRVIKRFADDPSNISTIVAGTSCFNSSETSLTYPHGIFVDNNYTLYVADSGNNRIQRFLVNETVGTTVAGVGASSTIVLHCPRAVILDGDGHLFILDSNNQRIVAERPDGFRCIIGCQSGNHPRSQSLRFPYSMSFDSYGNIFVADQGDHQIQKFFLNSNHCGEYLSLAMEY